MKNIYEEFIRFDKNYSRGKNAFYGENSPLDEREKKEFLKEYVAYAKNRYGMDVSFKKAVSLEAISSSEEKLHLDKGEPFKVYKRNRKKEYENWNFYTARAVVEEDYVAFNEGYRFPVPAAKYDLPCGVKEFSFAVYIDKSYYHPHNVVGACTTSRFIEFRQNCTEAIKLCFAPNGTFCQKDGREKPYHYKVVELGKYAFDEWNTVKIVFHEKYFELTFNGETFTLYYSNPMIPDNFYMGGGMQPVKFWRVKPLSLVTEKESVAEFFKRATSTAATEEYICEKPLPVVLGTKENRDKELVLRRTLYCPENNEYRLHIGALDPGGAVYINGKMIVEKDDFQPFTMDITPYVKTGSNSLEIVVYPRAPETLYPWHRHDDYYNGWFCLSADVSMNGKHGVNDIRVTTLQVGEKSTFCVNAQISNCDLFGKEYALFLTKVYPEKGETVLLKKSVLTGDIDESFTMPIELWNVDSPNLYTVRIEVYDQFEVYCNGETEVGFRTVEQKRGSIYINGEKTVLKGALNMQFLPPYDEIPLNHVCPSDRQIVEQVLAVKGMNGNCMRLHQLGYGCGDRRFARICDRLGILLIWTTRLIDSIENVKWTDEWKQAKDYQKQIAEVFNSPSIIMWEGTNECKDDLEKVDRFYDHFVSAVKEVDQSRLICPVSHLYYGGGLYGGGHYYSDDGTYDEVGNTVRSSFGWTDKSVVRSAHTYCLLLGYGSPWERMVAQDWKWQNELFENEERAYLVSEYAIIGRQNPETDEAKAFINKNSYEFNDEFDSLGFTFTDEEWELSQAYQAVCTSLATKQLIKNDADGMLWCCLWGGANNASYLKPIIDFYGYTKLAYYSLKESFQETLAFNETPDVLLYDGYTLSPVICGVKAHKRYSVRICVCAQNGETVDEKTYTNVMGTGRIKLPPFQPHFVNNGYYTLRYEVVEE